MSGTRRTHLIASMQDLVYKGTVRLPALSSIISIVLIGALMCACERQPDAGSSRPAAVPIEIKRAFVAKRSQRAELSPPCVTPGPTPFVPHTEHHAPKAGEPALFTAARTGDMDAMKRLLAASPPIDAPFDIGLDPDAREAFATALMVALGSGDGAGVEAARLLLDAGANVNARLNCGTPFTFAAKGLGWGYKPGGDAERLQLVIDRGGTPPTDSETRAEIMCEVAGAGDATRLRILLDLGFSPNPEWDRGAAQRRHEESLKATRASMVHMQARLSEALKSTMPDLDLDAANAKLDGALAEIGTQVRGPWHHDIPLFQAVISGSVPTVGLLLSRGANVNQVDSDGRTALFFAWSPAIVRRLLEAGADPTITSESGTDAVVGIFEACRDAGVDHAPIGCLVESSLQIAAANPRFDPVRFPKWPDSKLAYAANRRLDGAVEVLLRLGAPAAPPAGKPSALHQVCWHGSYEDKALNRAAVKVVELLVQAGAPIDGRDDAGLTPIHMAVGGDWGNAHTARALLELGASPDPKDGEGQTPLMNAAQMGELSCVVALLEYGADPSVQDSEGKTAVDFALDHLDLVRESAKSPEIARALREAMGQDAEDPGALAHDEERLRDAEIMVATLRAEARKPRNGPAPNPGGPR